MRTLLCVLLSLLPLAPTVAAEPAKDEAVRGLSAADARTRRDAVARLAEIGTMSDLGSLVGALRDVDEDTRDGAAEAMWRIFARSGNDEVDRLYEVGVRQTAAGEVQEGIATFSRIIVMKPEFAEGWNKRATLYFMAGELRKSIADCDEVMKRNPYHFGALAGYAQIHILLENYDRALEYSRRALAVNPNMEGVRRNLRLLEEIQAERQRQMI